MRIEVVTCASCDEHEAAERCAAPQCVVNGSPRSMRIKGRARLREFGVPAGVLMRYPVHECRADCHRLEEQPSPTVRADHRSGTVVPSQYWEAFRGPSTNYPPSPA